MSDLLVLGNCILGLGLVLMAASEILKMVINKRMLDDYVQGKPVDVILDPFGDFIYKALSKTKNLTEWQKFQKLVAFRGASKKEAILKYASYIVTSVGAVVVVYSLRAVLENGKVSMCAWFALALLAPWIITCLVSFFCYLARWLTFKIKK